ncbi:energy transducer TonB [Mucilaginibacter sp.]|uniref:energy transducer TonB n=1 Tax=Mucilaginibacter sp. TaxID=1882438 RepID=UPI002621F50D|nr:energy transducer TonB [Mucilaginibacter sp.]MDB5031203.1 transport protein TonB [Mucilaginibacter sp.]
MKKILFILIVIAFALKTQAQVQAITSPDQDSIFTTNIDVAPEFKDGMDRFYARLHRIAYTFTDRFREHQGRVIVIMVIEKDGSISNLKVLHGFSEKQNHEILRVIKRLNKWKPGMRSGKPVRVLCSIPIDFKLIKS